VATALRTETERSSSCPAVPREQGGRSGGLVSSARATRAVPQTVRILPIVWRCRSLHGKAGRMKKPIEQAYPDVSDIFQRKAEAREQNAALSFGEKIKRLEALRERVAPFNRARERREAERRK